jgi:hypothetical protein
MPFQWTDPNALGLLYDMAGILILGVPSLLVPAETLAKESSSGWGGGSAGLARRLAEWKIDTCMASVLLAIGFALQLTAAVGYMLLTYGAIILWFLLVGVCATYLFLRTRAIQWYSARIQQHWRTE